MYRYILSSFIAQSYIVKRRSKVYIQFVTFAYRKTLYRLNKYSDFYLDDTSFKTKANGMGNGQELKNKLKYAANYLAKLR